MTQSRKSLHSREERTHNVVPVTPHDLTSQAYHRENSAKQRSKHGVCYKPCNLGILYCFPVFHPRASYWVMGAIQIENDPKVKDALLAFEEYLTWASAPFCTHQ